MLDRLLCGSGIVAGNLSFEIQEVRIECRAARVGADREVLKPGTFEVVQWFEPHPRLNWPCRSIDPADHRDLPENFFTGSLPCPVRRPFLTSAT